MNRTVVLILAGAVLVAILVAMIVQANLAPEKTVEAAPTTEILVAAKPLYAGDLLTAASVRWQAWPQDAVFTGAVLKSAEPDLEKLSVYDSPLRRGLETGEPVTANALIGDIKGTGNFVAASLAPGMRAVSIAVKPDTGVSGLIVPGDRVDVILAYTPRLTGEGRDLGQTLVSRDATQTVLSNLRVVGVDQSTGNAGAPKEGAAKIAKTVTLEVTQEQAEILVLAKQMGDISLALRRLGEKDDPAAPPTPVTTDMNTSEIMLKVNEALRKSKTVSNTVRVYSGGAVQNVPVRSGQKPDAPAASQQ